MTSRDPEVSTYVDAFRQDVETQVDVDAAWAQFQESIAPVPSSATRGPMLWVAAAAVLAAAAVAVWVFGAGATLDGSEPDAVEQAPDHVSGQGWGPVERSAPPQGVTHSPEPPDAPGSPSDPAAPAPGEADAPAASADGRPRAKVARPAEPEPEPESEPRSSRLAEELRLLEQMRASSTAGRHADALRIAEEHAGSFGDGTFAPERELTRVRALCGLGRDAETQKAKARFVARFPNSHLLAQVRAVCAE